jgi:cell surface protein SprA
LKFDYSASAKSLIDEPQGRIDTKEKKQQIRKSFGEFGTMNDFSQTINASYHIPVDKIPIFSFINSNLRYTATSSWAASAKAIRFLGNRIENSNTKGFDANLNFMTLYNKSKYLRKVNQGTFGSSLKDKPIIKNKQQPTMPAAELAKLPKQQQDSIRAKEKERAENQKNVGKEILDNFLRLLMMVRTASFTYTEGNAMSINGFMLEPDLIGLNVKHNGAPGFLFVFGDQDEQLLYRAGQNGWLTTSDMLNTPYQQRHNTTLNIKLSLEPIKDVRIDLSANRTYSRMMQSFYVADTHGVFHDYSRQQTGNFSITTFCARTFFVKDKRVSGTSSMDNYRNQNFENFKNFRIIIANRLAEARRQAHPDYVRGTDEYPDGYGSLDQEVLLHAFWAAYSGISPEKVKTGSPFFNIPLPNWTITYNGLIRIPGVNKVFQTFSLRHSYSCLYQLGGYSTNLAFDPDRGNMQEIRDALNNFIPYIEVGQAAINESMNPLIGFDMSLKNSLQFKAEWRKSRTITLSMTNFQVTENANDEIVFGAGYRIKGLDIVFNFAGVRRKTEGELALRADFSIRDNKTILRKIEEDVNQASSGQRILQIAFNAEYLFTKNFSIKLFYDHNLTQPALSNQYRTLTISAGLSLKIMLTDL